MFKNGPSISVYIPCRNYGRYLSQAVRSVQKQLYPNWELFIIDEASEDETVAIADSFSKEDPERIHVVRHDAPLGLQRSANEVLKYARGRYIIRLDADDWLDESALLLMVAKLESDSGLGIVYGNYYYTDEQGAVIGVERRRKLGVEDASGHLPPHGACTMVRTRALKSVGGYSEDVDAQDGWELWFKLLNKVRAASIDAPLFFYRQHVQSLSRDSSRLLNARARILEKAGNRFDGSYAPSCVAVIPVRESYPGIEGMPYQEIGGQSLLELAIRSAQGTSGVDDVIVSSATDSVLEFARGLDHDGVVQPHMRVKRPPELAGSHIKLREILRHAGEESFREKGHFPDILLFLSLHAPKRQAMHVDKAINTLKVTCSDSVVSVCEEGEPMFAHGRDGLELLNPGRFDELVFERERLFKFNGAVLAVWGEIIQDGGLFGTSIGFVEMSKEDSRQIKTPADLLSLRVEGGLDEPTGTGADRGPPGSARKAPLGLALDKES